MKKVSLRLRHGSAALVVFAAGAASAAGNLVVNGSFEVPDISVSQGYSCFTNVTSANWTNSQGTGGHGSCYIQQNTDVFGAAYRGEQLMYLNDYGAAGTGIAQSLTLTVGTTYQLTFLVSGVKDRANAGGLQVQFGSFSAIVAASASAGTWHGYVYQYTPLASGAAQLKFTSTSNAPVNIDAVSLVALPPVPEPTTWALMLSGPLALGALRRRQV